MCCFSHGVLWSSVTFLATLLRTHISLLIEYNAKSIRRVGGKACEREKEEGTIALADS